jgi:hypothetical protein
MVYTSCSDRDTVDMSIESKYKKGPGVLQLSFSLVSTTAQPWRYIVTIKSLPDFKYLDTPSLSLFTLFGKSFQI